MTTGTEGNDRLTNDPNEQHERVEAMGGDDQIIIIPPETTPGEPSTIFVDGGAGDDTLSVGPDLIDGVQAEFLAGTIEMRKSDAHTYTVTYSSIQNLILHGVIAGDSIVTGTSNDDLHFVGAWVPADVWSGAGNDRIYLANNHAGGLFNAGAGNDRIDLSAATVIVDTMLTAQGADGDDVIIGSDGADRLDGGNGDDTIQGMGGNDNITGGNGNDHIDGGLGNDVMNGGMGNDVYVVDSRGDSVIEAAGGGIDDVHSWVTYYLSNSYEIEQLSLLGTANISAYGNNMMNTLIGNTGNNTLDGRGGADIMAGNEGDDTYIVDDMNDQVVEHEFAGNDTVRSGMSWTLSDAYEIENLVLTGSAAINGTGNSLANSIVGNDAANTLDGRGGADVLRGEGGDDTYIVDDRNDTVIETAGEGRDTVRSSVTYFLSDSYEVERLFLTGTADIDAYGNNLNNTIVGNSGNNLINGRGGVDVMNGGAGNDHYIVDSISDTVIEETGGGLDTVSSYSTYYLSEKYEIENLNLLGSADVNAFGNSLDNRITGNSGNNAIGGGRGDDTLRGGAGQDGFYFNTALNEETNVDRILDFAPADDTIFLDDAIFTEIDEGMLSEDAYHEGTSAADAEDRIIYDQATGRIWYDADGSGEGEAILFAMVTPGTDLTNADFIAY